MSDDPKAAVESFLRECGLKMTEISQFGEKLNIEPFYCIVEAEKEATDSIAAGSPSNRFAKKRAIAVLLVYSTLACSQLPVLLAGISHLG